MLKWYGERWQTEEIFQQDNTLPHMAPKEFKFLKKWAEKYFNTLLIVFCTYVVMNSVQWSKTCGSES